MVKTFFIVLIISLLPGTILANSQYCYRNSASTLSCAKSMDEIPLEYRSVAFYKAGMQDQRIPLSENNPTYKIETANTLPAARELSKIQEIPNSDQPIQSENTHDSKLQIFVASWCSHCKALEKYLKNRGIQYSRYDVETDTFGAQVYEQEGTIPISILNGKTILGFDPRRYGEIIDAELPY